MIVVLGFTAYWPTLKLGFLWDDHIMIESNPRVSTWSLANVKFDFTHDAFERRGDAYYRPLTHLMNRIDHSLWGMRPLGYHLNNLLFHIGNALLAVELLLLLGAAPLMAFIAGSLFVVHPMIVEQLMIVAGRAEIACLFFSLTALCLFLPGKRWHTMGGVLAFLAALASKENAVMVPFQWAILMYWRREPIKNYVQPAALLLLVFPYLWVRQNAVGDVFPPTELWMSCRFFVQAFPRVVFRYLGLMVWPWNLHSHRMLPHLSLWWPVALALLVTLCAYVVQRYKRIGITLLLWFFVALLPKTLVMMNGNFMLDHFVYPALFSLLVPAAWFISKAWEKKGQDQQRFTGILYTGAIILWALLAHLNVELRGTDEKMYRWALHFTESNPIHYNLGVLLLNTNRAREAIPHLNEAASLYPENPDYRHALAVAYGQASSLTLSKRMLEQLLKEHPTYAPARQSLKAANQLLQKKK